MMFDFITKMNPQTFARYILLLLSGALLVAAFAPFNYPIAAIISLVVLLGMSDEKHQGKTAFLRGFIYGMGFFGLGVSWVFISIHRFGNANIFVAAILTFLFVAVLAFFMGLWIWLVDRLFIERSHFTRYAIGYPAAFVITEWLRSHIFTGFPWLLLACSGLNTSLAGFAPVIGDAGLAFLMVFCSGMIVWWWQARTRRRLRIAVCLIAIVFATGSFLKTIHWTHPTGKPLSVALVQGNIPQAIKWSPDALSHTLERYQSLTDAHWQQDLILWPEAAIPAFPEQVEAYLSRLDTEAKAHHTALVVGLPLTDDHYEQVYNGAIVLGAGKGTYVKQHLVPFGEYLPFKQYLKPLLHFLSIPMSDFSTDPKKADPLIVKGQRLGMLICYEIAYARLARLRAENAGILSVISNDAWFGDSFAPDQHLSLARLRALETGRPILFVSNTGITAIVSARGETLAELPRSQTAVLTGEIRATTGQTPWMRSGESVFVSVCLLLLAIFVLGFRA